MSIASNKIKKEDIKKAPIKERYYEAVGRRKTAAARVRLFANQAGVTVNDKDYKEYFKSIKHQQVVELALKAAKLDKPLGAIVKVSGSGINAQAEAVRHGIARALVKFNSELKDNMRRAGLLTRDARMVERKKPGLKKARRAPQWRKR